jgi:hypothetical protein
VGAAAGLDVAEAGGQREGGCQDGEAGGGDELPAPGAATIRAEKLPATAAAPVSAMGQRRSVEQTTIVPGCARSGAR